MKSSFLLSIALSSLLTPAYAATQFTEAEQAEMVTAHNTYRSEVAIPAIKWSTTLANTAQAYADKLKTTNACKMVHSGASGLGENLYWASPIKQSNGTSKPQTMTHTKAVDSWGSEKANYTYATNTCAENKVCGHYTQVVWKNTTEIGCGKAICADNSQVLVCNYTPAGNFVGQKPY